MSDDKREQERAELYKSIWAIANDLRGSVDGWDFKNYVLTTLFYRYISENLAEYINKGEREAGTESFDYAKMSDETAEGARDGLIEEKGFFILPSELFCNVVARAKDDPDLNETLEKIFRHIEESAMGTESEDDFKGLFSDFDVNSNKLGGTVAQRNDKLVKLLNGINSINFGVNHETAIDAFGDTYEYLMGMYAQNAGKSGGEYFTPQEVSRLLTLLGLGGRKKVNKVYDPACGSGSLLLQSAKILGDENVKWGYFGQEINITTYNLCRINMFLHDIGYDKFDIAHGDTLTNPLHWDDEPFDLIVSNPPYSIKWEGDSNPVLINDERFSPAGVLAPKGKADLAFVMHALSWLSAEGTASIVCFPGVMYRGGTEQKIRKYLIDNNFVDAVIQMPDNLFYGTTIATCLLILKRNRSDNRVTFIDASRECVKITNANKLTEDNIQNIYQYFMYREDVEYTVKMVDTDKIADENYNLSVSTFVKKQDTREKVDIVKLNTEIKDIVTRGQILSDEINNVIADIDGGIILPSFDEVQMVRIGDLGKWVGGKTPSMSEKRFWKNGTIPWISSKDMKKPVLSDTQDHITNEAVTEASMVLLPAGSVAIVTRSGILKHTFPVSYVPFETTINQDIKGLIHNENVDPQYVAFVMQAFGEDIRRETKKLGGTVDSLDFDKIKKIKIPLPRIEIQTYLVRILAGFECIYDDLNDNLSIEIATRKKQYNYYRKKLLSFKKEFE